MIFRSIKGHISTGMADLVVESLFPSWYRQHHRHFRHPEDAVHVEFYSHKLRSSFRFLSPTSMFQIQVVSRL